MGIILNVYLNDTNHSENWRYKEFEVPDQVYQTFRAHSARGVAQEAVWKQLWSRYQQAEPVLAAQFQRAILDGALPDGWADALPRVAAHAKSKATRIHSHDCLNALASVMPELIGGSADLASSNMTQLQCSGNFARGQYGERNMRFGVREFGMAAIAGGMSLHRTGFLPYCATFTVFTDYMRAAIRVAALSQAGTIFVTTHASIGVGEDGPTHQPVETIPSLRLIPNLTVLRPADGNETGGAYVAWGATAPELILIATGSEFSLCIDAAKTME